MADFETKSSTKSMSGMLNVRRTFSYALLVILTVLSVFPFLILIVNSSRTHAAIQTTFTLLPGTKFLSNFTKLVVVVTDGTPRFLFNRDVDEGQWSETESESHLIDNTRGGWSSKYFKEGI